MLKSPPIGRFVHYNWRDHKVKDIHDGVFDPTRFASPQGTLLP